MFERKVLVYDTVYRYHRVVSIAHDLSVGITTIHCNHWNRETNIYMTSHEHTLEVGLTFEDAEDYLKGLDEFTPLPDDESALIDAQEVIAEQASVIADISDILTDEQAELMPNIYPEWAVNTEYAVGKRVRYNDKLYRCVQAHTSQEGWEPSSTPALWTRTAPEGTIPEWIQPTGAQDAYNTGDKVTHNSKTWESTVDANVWEPGVYGWAEVTE